MRRYGLPGLTTVRARSKLMETSFEFRFSVGVPLTELVSQNIETVLKSHGSLSAIWSIKCDELAIQKRLRWNQKDNKIYGLCSEHTDDNIVFTNFEDAERVMHLIETGACHIAKEALVFVLVRLGEKGIYCTYPILSAPICSHSCAELQKSIFRQIESTFRRCAKKYECGKLLNIGTDGDGTRRRVLHGLTQCPQIVEKKIQVGKSKSCRICSYSIHLLD